MPKSTPPTEAEIREQAYYLWEAEGRPDGRGHDYWARANALLTEKAAIEAAAAKKPIPKLKNPPAKATKRLVEGKPKAAPKLKSAASKARPVPSKSSKADGKRKKK